MKNLIFILLSVVLLSSCVTRNRCNRLFPPETIKSDSLVSLSSETNSIQIRDTIIHDTVRLKGDIITLHDTLPCPGLNYSKKEKKNRITAEINIKNGVIDVTCMEDSIIHAHSIEVAKYKTVITKQRALLQTSTSNKKETRNVNHIPWWIYLIIGALLTVIVYQFVKKK